MATIKERQYMAIGAGITLDDSGNITLKITSGMYEMIRYRMQNHDLTALLTIDWYEERDVVENVFDGNGTLSMWMHEPDRNAGWKIVHRDGELYYIDADGNESPMPDTITLKYETGDNEHNG